MKKVITLSDYLPDLVIPKQGRSKVLRVKSSKRKLLLSCKKSRKNISISKEITLSNSDFVAIGLYLAEGYTKVNKKAIYNHDGSVTFVGSYKEMLIPFCDLLAKLGVQKRYLKWRVGINVNIEKRDSKILYYWSREINLSIYNLRTSSIYRTGTLGKSTIRSGKNGCVHIFYPSVVFRSFFIYFIHKIFEESLLSRNIPELSLILRGFFAGDGCVYFDKRYNTMFVDFASNNPELISNLRKALTIIGVNVIKETYPEFGKSNNKSLRMYSKSDFDVLNDHNIINLLGYKAKIFHNLLESY